MTGGKLGYQFSHPVEGCYELGHSSDTRNEENLSERLIWGKTLVCSFWDMKYFLVSHTPYFSAKGKKKETITELSKYFSAQHCM